MDKYASIVGDLFDVVKALVEASAKRGEAIDKAIAERLTKAEQGLYEARRTAFEREAKELADRLTENTQSKFDLP